MISRNKKPSHPNTYMAKAWLIGLSSVPFLLGITFLGDIIGNYSYSIQEFRSQFSYLIPSIILTELIKLVPSASSLARTEAPIIMWVLFCNAYILWALISVIRNVALSNLDFRESYDIELSVQKEVSAATVIKTPKVVISDTSDDGVMHRLPD